MAESPDLPKCAAGTTLPATRDQLLLAAWRKMIIGQGDCPVLALELGAACGAEAGATHGAIMAFVTALAAASRRRLRVGYPGCPGITGDERQMLALIAAAQNGAGAAVEAHLRWLTSAPRRTRVVGATRVLAAELTARRLMPTAANVPPDPGCALCLRVAEATAVTGIHTQVQ